MKKQSEKKYQFDKLSPYHGTKIDDRMELER